jgi:hypothetical protein
MDKPEAYDVVYHKYPTPHIEADDKPVAVAIAVADAASAQPLPPNDNGSRSAIGGVLRAMCRVPVLLVFHTANAALGIGGAIIVLVVFPLSIGFLPLGCVGAVLFQILAVVVRWLAMADIAFANLTNCKSKRMEVAFGIQSGFSPNNGCNGFARRLFFVSPKSLLVMLYLSTIKLAIGCLSCAVSAFVVAVPIQIAVTNGDALMFGDGLTYDNHPSGYVWTYVGVWVLGVAMIFPVWWLSVKLTDYFCADHDDETTVAVEIETPRGEDAKNAVF